MDQLDRIYPHCSASVEELAWRRAEDLLEEAVGAAIEVLADDMRRPRCRAPRRPHAVRQRWTRRAEGCKR